MIAVPVNARPHEVAVLRIYLMETREAPEIARLLNYKSATAVYRILRRHRDFLAEQRKLLSLGSHTTVHILHA